MHRFAIAPLALLLCLAPLTASAAPGERDADAAFERMLAGVETVPTKEALERAWPDARARLLAAAQQDERDGYTRSRAISFLGYYPDAGVREALSDLVAHQRAAVRKTAVYTLGRTFGRPGDMALVKAVHAVTADADASVAGMAVRTLRWVDHAAAEDALQRIEREHAAAELRRLARITLERRARRLGRN